MAPRVHRGAIASGIIRRLELHRDTGVNRRLRTGVGAHAVHGANAIDRTGMVETELVLPVAPGNPHVDEVSVLRTPDRLAGVEGQTDRLAVQLGLGRHDPGKRSVRVTLRSVPASATADCEKLPVRREEAEIHVIKDFDRPCGLEPRVAIYQAIYPRIGTRKHTALVERVVVDFLVGQGRYVEETLVRKIKGELQTAHEGTLARSQERVFRLILRGDLERNVMQRPHGEGLGIEEFVPAERADGLAEELDGASAGRRGGKNEASIRARSGRIVMVRLDVIGDEKVG